MIKNDFIKKTDLTLDVILQLTSRTAVKLIADSKYNELQTVWEKVL
jgi:hypothetical protein